jgi:hypothetical protein
MDKEILHENRLFLKRGVIYLAWAKELPGKIYALNLQPREVTFNKPRQGIKTLNREPSLVPKMRNRRNGKGIQVLCWKESVAEASRE